MRVAQPGSPRRTLRHLGKPLSAVVKFSSFEVKRRERYPEFLKVLKLASIVTVDNTQIEQ